MTGAGPQKPSASAAWKPPWAPALRGRLGASVPYRTGHSLAVPCAASRRPQAPRKGGPAGWPPSSPAPLIPGIRRPRRGGCPASAPGCGPWAAEDGLCGRLASGYNYHLASGGSRDGGPLRGRLPNRPSTRGGSGSRPAASAAGARARSPLGNLDPGEAEARRDRRPAAAAGGLPGRSVSNQSLGRPHGPRGPLTGLTIVTWLILPVVICLSQRLSHACLSISNYTAKLRMAHYISYRLFDSTLLLG